MRLLFIYVKNYKCLKNAQMNFSDSIRFDFNTETLSLTKTHENNQNLFPIKSNSSVKNISAIVGSNGSGKTSVCSLLYDVFISGNSQIEHIFIYESGGRFIIHEHLAANQEIQNVTGLTLLKYDAHKSKQNIIYYSPFYMTTNSMGTCKAGTDIFCNISTSFLLENDITYYANERTGVDYPYQVKQTVANSILDMSRCTTFLKTAQKIKKMSILNITVPKELIFSLDLNTLRSFESELKDNEDVNAVYNELFELTNNTLQSDYVSNNPKKQFLRNFMLYLFYNFARAQLLNNHFGIAEDIRSEYLARIKYALENTTPTDGNEVLRTVFKNFSSSNNFTDTLIYPISKEKTNSLNRIIDYLYLLDEKYFTKDILTFDIKGDSAIINEFYDLYQNSKSLTEYGNFTFSPSPSSGEMSEILLYSRIFEQLTRMEESSNILLFLDEAETTLHPRLQQHIVQNLIVFFDNFFVDRNFKIQIIFATHSPILLSDLPVTNIVFLKKDSGSEITTVVTRDRKQTFASNIYQLYQDSFFLDDTLIGDFAKNQINQVIDELNKNENYEATLEKVSVSDRSKYIASLVGEPLLRKLIQERIK